MLLQAQAETGACLRAASLATRKEDYKGAVAECALLLSRVRVGVCLCVSKDNTSFWMRISCVCTVPCRYRKALALDPEDAGKQVCKLSSQTNGFHTLLCMLIAAVFMQGLNKLLAKAEKAAKKDEVYPWQ